MKVGGDPCRRQMVSEDVRAQNIGIFFKGTLGENPTSYKSFVFSGTLFFPYDEKL